MAKIGSVYQDIKQLIASGELPEGTILVEREVGERLGVSRVPVREALLQLSTEGFFVEATTKGLVVKSYSFRQIAEAYFYREALDGMAARGFALQASESEKEYLTMVYRIMEERISEKYTDFWVRKDVEFHQVIAQGCRNEWITRSLENVYEMYSFLVRKHLTPTLDTLDSEHRTRIAIEVLEEHKHILDAILEGDEDAAESAARASVKAASSRMLRRHAAHDRGDVS